MNTSASPSRVSFAPVLVAQEKQDAPQEQTLSQRCAPSHDGSWGPDVRPRGVIYASFGLREYNLMRHRPKRSNKMRELGSMNQRLRNSNGLILFIDTVHDAARSFRRR